MPVIMQKTCQTGEKGTVIAMFFTEKMDPNENEYETC
jgi:hypothetical protein